MRANELPTSTSRTSSCRTSSVEDGHDSALCRQALALPGPIPLQLRRDSAGMGRGIRLIGELSLKVPLPSKFCQSSRPRTRGRTIREGAEHRHRLHFDNGTGHRRGRPGSGDSGRRAVFSRVVLAATWAYRSRANTRANCTFFCLSTESLLQSVALLRLAEAGWVEDVKPAAHAMHVLAHQVMALILQEGGISRHKLMPWVEAFPGRMAQ
jgi:hypothetical protein